MEIERKFKVSSLPSGIEGYTNVHIRQRYLSFGDGESPERRVRHACKDGKDVYYLTEKSEGLLARVENEREISSEEYASLCADALTDDVRKTRYYVPLDGDLTAELDVYEGDLSGLVTVEVEFESIEEARGFAPPEWFGDEVTEDKAYKNKSLARFGLPKN